MSVEVLESFGRYRPPSWVRPAVQQMLRSIPEKYTVGLHSVILTNHGEMNRAHRRKKVFRRGRKFAVKDAAGLYRKAWHGRPASIEVFVKEILAKKSIVWRIPLLRELPLGLTLFHEVGHHIHHVARPEYAEKEDVADRWAGRLLGNYLKKRARLVYWALFPITKIFRLTRRRGKRGRKL